jgi:hypothetical protein
MAVNHLQKQRGRGPGRPFAKGLSGNPAAQPLGARNAATQLAEALLDGEAEALTRKLVERIVPRRARTHPFALPEINSAADLAPAMGAIVRAAAAGAITPFDAAELARMVETALRAIEAGEFDRRLAALERSIELSRLNHCPFGLNHLSVALAGLDRPSTSSLEAFAIEDMHSRAKPGEGKQRGLSLRDRAPRG